MKATLLRKIGTVLLPAIALILLAALLAACGRNGADLADASSASPTATSEASETVSFSVFWDEEKLYAEPYFVEVPMEKCWLLSFDLTATEKVEVRYFQPGEEFHAGTWGLVTDLSGNLNAESEGVLRLEVKRQWEQTTPSEVTVSYRRSPPRNEC